MAVSGSFEQRPCSEEPPFGGVVTPALRRFSTDNPGNFSSEIGADPLRRDRFEQIRAPRPLKTVGQIFDAAAVSLDRHSPREGSRLIRDGATLTLVPERRNARQNRDSKTQNKKHAFADFCGHRNRPLAKRAAACCTPPKQTLPPPPWILLVLPPSLSAPACPRPS